VELNFGSFLAMGRGMVRLGSVPDGKTFDSLVGSI